MADFPRNSWLRKQSSRRTVLRNAGAVGFAGLAGALVGCAGDDGESAPASSGGSTISPGGTTSPGSGSPISRGGTLTIAAQQEPGVIRIGSGLDPHIGGDELLITEGMVGIDAEFRAIPALAESFEQAEPTELVFQLRPGVKFHDGSDFTSEDVRVSLERVLDPEVGSPAAGALSAIDAVETPDNQTVIVRTSRPSAALLLNLTDKGGQVISAEQLMAGDTAAIARSPLGTGPYVMGEWRDGSYLEVKANPEYWGRDEHGDPLPYLDAQRHNFVLEGAVRVTEVATGSVDLAYGLDGVNFVAVQGEPDVTAVQYIGSAYQGLRLNLGFFPDVRIRQAMQWALDRQAISDSAFAGEGHPGTTPISPAHGWAFYEDYQDKVFEDLERARQLVDASGYDGSPFGCVYPAGSELPAQVVQGQLERVGINLELTEGPSGIYAEGGYSMYHSKGFTIRADPDGTIFDLFHSEGGLNAGSVTNHPDYVPDPELDRLITAAQEEFDLDTRAELYHQVERILVDDGHGTFYGYRTLGAGFGERVRDFAWTAKGDRYPTADLWLEG